MRVRTLLLASSLSSCFMPRVDFDASLGAAGNGSGGVSGTATIGGTSAGGASGGSNSVVTGNAGNADSGGAMSVAGSLDGVGGAAQGDGQGGNGDEIGRTAAAGTGESATSARGGASGAGSSAAGVSASGAAASGAGGGGRGGGAGGGSLNAGTGGGVAANGCAPLAPSTDPMCCIASATTSTDTLAIDDLEDDDNSILPLGAREGFWFAYHDAQSSDAALMSGALIPSAGNGHPCSLLPVPPACASTAGGTAYSAALTGILADSSVGPTFAGLGFDFNNHFGKGCPYDAHVYRGVSFWAKGNTPFRAMLKIPATTETSTGTSGSCVTNCEDYHGITVTPDADPTAWTQFTIIFSDTTNFAQQGWGTPAAFDPAALLSMQFQIGGSTTAMPYSFAVDDIAFIP